MALTITTTSIQRKMISRSNCCSLSKNEALLFVKCGGCKCGGTLKSDYNFKGKLA
jgi:hypothetical protein